jgi:2-keto-4-pentenoate hydratase
MSRELTAAQRIVEARDAHTLLEPLPGDCRPTTLAEGYAVQEVLHGLFAERRSAHRVGYKIGCTTTVMQENLGIDHPCAGSVNGEDVYQGRADLVLAQFVQPGVECEIGMIMARDLDPEHGPYDRDSVAEYIGAVMPAIEIVNNRYQGGPAIGVPTLVADDFFGAGAVLGEANEDWQGIDLAALEGRVRVDSTEMDKGLGAAVMGNPLEAAAWFANLKTARGEIIKAGEFILTGSLTVVQWIDKPCTVEADIAGLGTVSVKFS